MDSTVGENARELFRAGDHLSSHIFSFVDSMSLKCAAQLGIFEILNNHGKPMVLSDLVATLPVHPAKAHCVHRLMRVLVHSGFVAFNEAHNHEQEGYFLTSSCKIILQFQPLGLTGDPPALDPAMIMPWHYLSTWFQNEDATAFQTAHGRTLYDYMASNPSLHHRFNKSMASDSKVVLNVMLNDCRGAFEGLESLVDVGGGTGTIAKAIADSFPSIKCVVLDLPHVVSNLQGTKNLQFIGGDMFVEIPPGNAILLKWILHNYNDEDSIKILKQCKKAILNQNKRGKVIIVEMVIENNSKVEEESSRTQLYLDMSMMVMLNGLQRTRKEWENLFLAAGFIHCTITPMGSRSLIEVYP